MMIVDLVFVFLVSAAGACVPLLSVYLINKYKKNKAIANSLPPTYRNPIGFKTNHD